jgi:hypothetical protein
MTGTVSASMGPIGPEGDMFLSGNLNRWYMSARLYRIISRNTIVNLNENIKI